MNALPQKASDLQSTQTKLSSFWKLYFDKNYQGVLESISQKFVAESVPELIHLAGLSMIGGGKPEMGISLLKTACMLMPQVVNWYSNSSVVLCEKYPQEAIEFIKEGLKISENDILYFCGGNAYTGMEKFKEAAEMFEKGLKINPKSIEILLNLGNVYRRLDEPKKAFTCYEEILKLDPTNHRAQFNTASFKMSKGEHVPNAKEMCLKYLNIEDSAEVAFMLSLFLLDEGNYKDGWKMYSRRWESTLTAKDRIDIRAPLATSKEEIKNKKVIVFHEQGFGDSLQFCRYINMLSDVTKNVTIVVPIPLVRLFEKSFPQFPVTHSRQLAWPYDYEIPMLNLPLIFSTNSLEQVPNKLPYLFCEKVVKTPAKIGLIWAGHKRDDPDLAAVNSRRSLTFIHFQKIMEGFPLEMFASLQLGPEAKEAENHPIIKLLDPSMDFYASSDIIAGLDLVVSADTAPMHLSAALKSGQGKDGIDVVCLSRYDACWRYSKELHEKNGTPDKTEWYPNVKMIYQKEKGNWDTVIEEAREFIKKRYGI